MTAIKNLGFASRRLSAVSDFVVEARSLAQPFDIDFARKAGNATNFGV
jgi:hypothetical protein